MTAVRGSDAGDTLLADWQLAVEVRCVCWIMVNVAARLQRRPHLLRLQGHCSLDCARLVQTPHAPPRGAVAKFWRPITAHTPIVCATRLKLVVCSFLVC